MSARVFTGRNGTRSIRTLHRIWERQKGIICTGIESLLTNLDYNTSMVQDIQT